MTVVVLGCFGLAIWVLTKAKHFVGNHGQIEEVFLIGEEEESLLLVRLSWSTKSGPQRKESLFRADDGEWLGDIQSDAKPWLGWIGYRLDAFAIEFIDLRTGEIQQDISARLSEAAGKRPFQVKEVSSMYIKLLLQNGERREVPVASLLSSKTEPRPPMRGRETCAVDSRSPQSQSDKGLLRAVMVKSNAGPCVFSLNNKQASLFLHRSTAFGEGGVLLSAQDANKELLWSLDLDPVLEGDAVQMMAFRIEEGLLRFWLVRAQYGLYDVSLNPMDGTIEQIKTIL
jgi:hypothetical protein